MTAPTPAIAPNPTAPWDRASYRVPRQVATIVLALLIGAWLLASTAATVELGRRILALIVSAVGGS
jgi:hypothetical protein